MSQSEFQVLQEQIKGLTTLVNAQFTSQEAFNKSNFENIKTDVLGIKDHLSKINGSVQRHQEAITTSMVERAKLTQKQNDHTIDMEDMEGRLTLLEEVEAKHTLVCPNIPKIRALEDNQLSQASIKKWIVTSVATTGIILGGIWVLIQIYLKAHPGS